MTARTFTARQLAFIGTPADPQISVVVDDNALFHIKCNTNMLELLAREWLVLRRRSKESTQDRAYYPAL